MQIKIVDKEKAERTPDVKLVVTIYENDYRNLEHDRDVMYLLIDKYPALLRFEFTKSALYMSARRITPSRNNRVKLHIRCYRLAFTGILICPRSWSDWISLGKLPPTESSSSDGKMYIFKIYLNTCELKDKTFVNLLDDKSFYDIHLVSDGSVPANVAMHRAVLCAHSSMLKSMLLGEWKDDKEIKIKIKDASHQTLLDLREYLYLGILPGKDLVSLMEVAKKYRFENLLADCVFDMVSVVDSQNLLEYRQFAIDNKIPELLNALDHITTDELVRTANRLEMLKLSQVKGKSCVKDMETLKKDSRSQK
ncbi:kelch repeat and BTB domain-containing protein 4-like [Choristoneura fumiferana]|uniref:kelch repeat and BTB domain-containing protein 4-like n=1 Tax=Choristoneura fumiferana TaxID=7141 RepID=UPI003D159E10